MSQTNTFPLTKENLSSNDDGFDDTRDKLTVTGWANFNTFENPLNQTCQTYSIPNASGNEDEWADFESSSTPSTQHSLQRLNDEENDDDDAFGDYGEVQTAPNSQTPIQSITSLSTEQIVALISECFPLEPSQTLADASQTIAFPLTSFTTFKDPRRQLPCFEPSLSLWNVLANISNDPLGIQYQWPQSNIERFFHQALGVHERPHTNTIPPATEASSCDIDSQNKLSSPTVVLDSVAKENDQDLSSIDDNSPSVQTLPSDREDEPIAAPVVIHQNNTPMILTRPTSIKTIDLFPGSTTTLNDDTKPVIDSPANFRFIDPRALMF